MKYELLSFKENKTGAISTRFSDSLSIDDRVSTVGALSGGELRCLSIAIDLAVSRIYSLYSGQTIAPLILDEPFEGMDSVNRELAISILQTISNATPVVVVDHANEVKGLFDSVILVEKKNGVSAIRVE
jgi:DNA repair exonuclease SbcCD ATPase subunit